MWKPRLAKNIMSYAKKHHGLSCKEARQLKNLKKACLVAACQLKVAQGSYVQNVALINKLEWALTACLLKVHKLGYFYDFKKFFRRNRHINSARTIESFTENACWKRFRFQKQDLYDLQVALKLKLEHGEVFRADNGMKFSGEEVLLIGLHRYCIPGHSNKVCNRSSI